MSPPLLHNLQGVNLKEAGEPSVVDTFGMAG